MTLRRTILPITGAYLLLYLGWLAFGRGPYELRGLPGTLSLLFSALLAASLAARAISAQSSARMRLAWICLAAGLGLRAGGYLYRLAFPLFAPGSAVPGLPFEVFDLLSLAAVAAALLAHPRVMRTDASRLRLLIDAMLTTAATVTLVWIVVLQPVLAGNSNAAYLPAGDLLLLVVLLNLFLITDASRLPRSFRWISLGLIAFTFSDLAYSSVQVYQPGSLLDFGWAVGQLALLVAALDALRPHVIPPAPDSPADVLAPALAPSAPPVEAASGFARRAQARAPLLAALVLGGFALLNWQFDGQVNPLGLWMTVVVSLGLSSDRV